MEKHAASCRVQSILLQTPSDGQQKVISTLKLRGCGVSGSADPVLFHSSLRVESCVLQ